MREDTPQDSRMVRLAATEAAEQLAKDEGSPDGDERRWSWWQRVFGR